jgi:hypothetical protein
MECAKPPAQVGNLMINKWFFATAISFDVMIHPNSCHAQGLGRTKIMGRILDKKCAGRIDM